jgi:hypothetical protein
MILCQEETLVVERHDTVPVACQLPQIALSDANCTAQLAQVDEVVEKVRSTFEHGRVWDRSIAVILSDHEFRRQSTHAECAHMPLIAKRQEQGNRADLQEDTQAEEQVSACLGPASKSHDVVKRAAAPGEVDDGKHQRQRLAPAKHRRMAFQHLDLPPSVAKILSTQRR